MCPGEKLGEKIIRASLLVADLIVILDMGLTSFCRETKDEFKTVPSHRDLQIVFAWIP